MKRLIYTNANFQPQNFLAEWVISARKVANYTGDMLVLDYGLERWFVKFLSKYDVKTIKLDFDHTRFQADYLGLLFAITTARFIDAFPIIEKDYSEHTIAFFDADIWFQQPIDNIFELAARSEGVVYSPDVSWCRQGFFSSKEELRMPYENKIKDIIESYGSTIQGGFHCAKSDVLLSKLGEFRKLVRDGTFERDQVIVNWLYEFGKDNIDGYLYNCIGTDTYCNDQKLWCLKKTNEVCVGLHLAGPYHHDPERQLRNNFPSLFQEELKKNNIDPLKIAPYRNIFL
jgi:hypothetical protein